MKNEIYIYTFDINAYTSEEVNLFSTEELEKTWRDDEENKVGRFTLNEFLQIINEDSMPLDGVWVASNATAWDCEIINIINNK